MSPAGLRAPPCRVRFPGSSVSSFFCFSPPARGRSGALLCGWWARSCLPAPQGRTSAPSPSSPLSGGLVVCCGLCGWVLGFVRLGGWLLFWFWFCVLFVVAWCLGLCGVVCVLLLLVASSCFSCSGIYSPACEGLLTGRAAPAARTTAAICPRLGRELFRFCRFTTWQQLWRCGAGCRTLTCPRTDCPTAGLRASPGRRGTGVGCGGLVLLTLGRWPVFRRSPCRPVSLCSDLVSPEPGMMIWLRHRSSGIGQAGACRPVRPGAQQGEVVVC